MRHLLAVVASGCLLSACAETECARTRTESYAPIILYKNSQVPLRGNPTAEWAWWEAALTASTVRFYANLLKGKAQLAYAELVVVWNPDSLLQNTGVKAVFCDDGPSNCQDLGPHFTGTGSNPVPARADITAQLRSIIADGVYKNLGFETLGNGTNGARIYGVWIEAYWQ
jgi:hypothetical protein